MYMEAHEGGTNACEERQGRAHARAREEHIQQYSNARTQFLNASVAVCGARGMAARKHMKSTQIFAITAPHRAHGEGAPPTHRPRQTQNRPRLRPRPRHRHRHRHSRRHIELMAQMIATHTRSTAALRSTSDCLHSLLSVVCRRQPGKFPILPAFPQDDAAAACWQEDIFELPLHLCSRQADSCRPSHMARISVQRGSLADIPVLRWDQASSKFSRVSISPFKNLPASCWLHTTTCQDPTTAGA